MKKYIILCLISFIIKFDSLGQSGEYFFDNDPGFGNGSIINNTNLNQPFEFLIDIEDLDPGFHRFYIRIKDEGKWSHTISKGIYVFESNILLADIVEAEYFIDTDPGFGNGSKLPLQQLNSNYIFEDLIDTKDLAIGQHLLYIRSKNSLGQWSPTQITSFLACGINPPTANFDYILNGNTVTILDSALHANEYMYEFGDGEQSDISIPRHEYSEAGVYDICQTVTNGCSSDKICKQAQVLGLSAVSPLSGGNDGNVTISVFGAGLIKGTKVFLELNNTRLYADTTISNEQATNMIAMFTFSNAPLGEYSIGIDLINSSTIYYHESFEIMESSDQSIYTRILGRKTIRQGRFGSYAIQCVNNGNNDVFNIPLFIVFVSDTNDIEVDFNLEIINSNQISDGNSTSQPIYVNSDSIQTRTIINNKYPLYSPARLSGRLSSFYSIDTIYSYQQGRIYHLLVPYIAAKSSVELDFKLLTFSSTASSLKILSIALPPNVDIADQGSRINSSECFFDALQASYNIAFNNLFNGEQDEVAKCWQSIITNTITAGLDVAVNYAKNTSRSNPELVYDVGSALVDVGAECYGAFGQKTLLKIGLNGLKKFFGFINAYRLGLQIGSAINCYNGIIINEEQALIDIVRSRDPNEKIGNRNFLSSRYFSYENNFTYNIYFENVDTATAAAQEVFITDTLNVFQYELSSFTLKSFGFSDQIYDIPPGLKSYSQDIDLRPEKNLILRFNAHLDTLSGVAKWYLGSLDPTTMELVEDPILGFLPPNDDNAIGEGYVSFNIDLLNNLPHGSEVSNSAEIVFDLNDPIITPIWTNIKDIDPPVSNLENTGIVETTDSTYLVTWEGFDNDAGIAYYDLYISKDDGAFVKVLNKVNVEGILLELNDFAEYNIYTIAYDSAGNAEQKNGPELSLRRNKVTGVDVDFDLDLRVYPNPSNSLLTIIVGNNELSAVKIFDMKGDIRFDLNRLNTNEISLSIDNYEKGIYIIECIIENKFIRKKFIIN